MPDLYPLRFEPVYKNYIWGGRRFETALDRELPEGRIFAESWEVADHPDGESIIAAGPLVGRSLRAILESNGEELLGQHYPQAVFPLLLKYLDANQHLSLQVHPNDQCAVAMGLTDPGKTEAWYVVDAEPRSCLWAGFAEPVEQGVVEEALRNGSIERLLHRVEPEPGDCIFVPAGTVHAIGAGLLVAEIQQMSNNTFRLSDWGRLDVDGNARPLHIEEGVQAINYESGPVEPTRGRPTETPGVTRLVACDKFVLDHWQVRGSRRIETENRCLVVTVTTGCVSVDGDRMAPLRRGQTILIPASWGGADVKSVGDSPSELLTAHLP